MILVHRKPLLEQWKLRLSAFLNLDKSTIGQIGGGKNRPTGLLDVALFQSLDRKGRVDDRVADYGYVIVDECHHVSAVSFERVLTRVKAKYVLGLTATPYRRDGHQPIIHMQCGPIRYQVKKHDISDQGIRSYVIPKKTNFIYEWNEDSNIYDLWPELIQDEERNDMIISDILSVVDNGRYPIILTERKEHLNLLESRLRDKIYCLVVLHGGIKPRDRQKIMEELRNSPDGQPKAILATGSYIGEGFDDPRLDTLFLTMPISFKGKIVQYTGRLQRRYKTKTDIIIYDYVDKNVSVLARMFGRRLKAYRGIGFEVLEIL